MHYHTITLIPLPDIFFINFFFLRELVFLPLWKLPSSVLSLFFNSYVFRLLANFVILCVILYCDKNVIPLFWNVSLYFLLINNFINNKQHSNCCCESKIRVLGAVEFYYEMFYCSFDNTFS